MSDRPYPEPAEDRNSCRFLPARPGRVHGREGGRASDPDGVRRAQAGERCGRARDATTNEIRAVADRHPGAGLNAGTRPPTSWRLPDASFSRLPRGRPASSRPRHARSRPGRSRIEGPPSAPSHRYDARARDRRHPRPDGQASAPDAPHRRRESRRRSGMLAKGRLPTFWWKTGCARWGSGAAPVQTAFMRGQIRPGTEQEPPRNPRSASTWYMWSFAEKVPGRK